MKKLLILFFPVFLFLGYSAPVFAGDEDTDSTEHVDESTSEDAHASDSTSTASASQGDKHPEKGEKSADKADGHHLPPVWLVIPFALLLLMIATGPLFFAHFWHKNYPLVAILLALFVGCYYIFAMHDGDSVIHAAFEYVQFIALLAALFMASGGILIKVDKQGKPMTNVMLLIIGAILANFIGTTGASMLLIRPFIRLNKDRIKAYHVVFFIFMVSNVGGSLTPIGDPPLFMGFLKGVPFEWTLTHNVVPWAFAIIMLAIVFFLVDSRNKEGNETEIEYTGKISIIGTKNFIWILMIIACVFIDPNVIYDKTPGDIIPAISMTLHHKQEYFSFIREGLMLSIAFLSYYFANSKALKGNEFEFEPIKEVAFIFIGIFFTMIPALKLVADYASTNPDMITIDSLYWGTGALSGVLDNAPTYMNFTTAAISANGGNMEMMDVKAFANPAVSMFPSTGKTFDSTIALKELTAISIASVFFGAMTYIGNAPNFMVKSIAEQVGVKMPAFATYFVKYAIPILLPILTLVWVIFFYFGLIDYLM